MTHNKKELLNSNQTGTKLVYAIKGILLGSYWLCVLCH